MYLYIIKLSQLLVNNSNTIIGNKLVFIRSRFGINVIDTGYDVCLHNVIGTKLAL